MNLVQKVVVFQFNSDATKIIVLTSDTLLASNWNIIILKALDGSVLKSLYETSIVLSPSMIASLDPYTDWLFIFHTETIVTEWWDPITNLYNRNTDCHQRLYRFDLSTNPGSIVAPIQQEKVFEFLNTAIQYYPYHMKMIWKTGHLYIHTTSSYYNYIWLVSGIGLA